MSMATAREGRKGRRNRRRGLDAKLTPGELPKAELGELLKQWRHLHGVGAAAVLSAIDSRVRVFEKLSAHYCRPSVLRAEKVRQSLGFEEWRVYLPFLFFFSF